MADESKLKYSISVGAYGSVTVEAPTKDECVALFDAVTKTKKVSQLDEAIR